MRECGLKRYRRYADRRVTMSLPVRECGLKLGLRAEPQVRPPSLPVRECGLKRLILKDDDYAARGHSPCGSVD